MRTYVRGRRAFCAWRVDLARRQHTAESKTCPGVSTLLLALALLGGIAGAARGDCSPHQLVKLLGAGEPAKENFGYSVAISGDTAVVGEPGVLSCSLGAAYVFRFSGREWVQEAELTAAHPTPAGRFGWSVAVSDDTIVVGEPYAYNLGSWSGTAYVFQKPPGGWVDMTQTAKLTAADGAINDQLGWSVAVAGDTVIAAAPYDDDHGDDSGTVYVFEKPPGGWVDVSQIAKLAASDAAAGDRFGYSVRAPALLGPSTTRTGPAYHPYVTRVPPVRDPRTTRT